MTWKYFGHCADEDAAKKLKRELSKKYHPDKHGGDDTLMKEINAEFDSWERFFKGQTYTSGFADDPQPDGGFDWAGFAEQWKETTGNTGNHNWQADYEYARPKPPTQSEKLRETFNRLWEVVYLELELPYESVISALFMGVNQYTKDRYIYQADFDYITGKANIDPTELKTILKAYGIVIKEKTVF